MNTKRLIFTAFILISTAFFNGYSGRVKSFFSFTRREGASTTKNQQTEPKQVQTQVPSNPIAGSRINPIELHTKDGLVRKGFLTLRKKPKGNVVLCHPASYSKEFLTPYEDTIFHQYNCLKFDFRRHGEDSEKQYATLGKKEIHEIEAALNIIKNHPETKDLPTYGFGISMGAVILIEAESKKPQFDGLILQAPFDSLTRQASRSFSFFKIPLMDAFVLSYPTKLYAKNAFRIKLYPIRPVESITKITTPIFLIHAQDDPTISFKAFKRLKKAGKSIVKTWAPQTGLHTALFKTWTNIYTNECIEFLERVNPAKPKMVMKAAHDESKPETKKKLKKNDKGRIV